MRYSVNMNKALNPLILWTLFLSGCSAPPDAEQFIIHPLCINDLVQQQEEQNHIPQSLNLEKCQLKYQSISFDQGTPWSASWSQNQNINLPDQEPLPAFSSYKIIGDMESHQMLVHYTVNYGGSGTFSYALLLEGVPSPDNPYPSKLTLQRVLTSGDRCFGGIDSLLISGPDTALVTTNITPAALIAYNQNKNRDSNLPDCALCCMGTISEQYSLDGKVHLKQVTLFPPNINSFNSAEQQCLYQLIPELEKNRIELNHEELAALQSQYWQNCISDQKVH